MSRIPITVTRTSSDVGTMTERGGRRGTPVAARGSEEFLLGGTYRGRSTLSLCSCEPDKYTQNGYPIDPHRPIFQYSLDRKRPKHTYTCEQNANILLRLERNLASSLKRTDSNKKIPAQTKSKSKRVAQSPSVGNSSKENHSHHHIHYHHQPRSIPDLNQIDLYETNVLEQPKKMCRRHFENKQNVAHITRYDEYNLKLPRNCPNQNGGDFPLNYNLNSNDRFTRELNGPCFVNFDRQRNFEMFDTGSFIPHRADITVSDSEPELTSLNISRHLAGCPRITTGYTHLEEEERCFPPAPDVTCPTRGKKHHQKPDTPPWRHRPPAPTTSHTSNASTSSGGSSRLEFSGRHWWVITGILLIAGAAGVGVPLALRVAEGAPLEERLQIATRLLEAVPLIDGHNDLPWNIRKFLHNQLKDFKFGEDLRNTTPWSTSAWSHTDLPRLKRGRVAAQFWAAYVPCEGAAHRDAVQTTLEQIDVIRRLTERFHPPLTPCTSVADIVSAHEAHQVCSLIGVEGGHSIGGSLAVLRVLHTLGVRYLTLTSSCHTAWADSSLADSPTGKGARNGGLSNFGKMVVKEMNRLGIIVDLSHTSIKTMKDTLAVSKAPVIFSHSSAQALCNASRNVPDVMIKKVALNKGLIMVNFYPPFLTCRESATVQDAVAHINHIREVAGVEFVGLGAGYDGINYTPVGLEDVSTYPLLFAELLGSGWSEDDLTKLAGQNFLRVLGAVERLSEEQKKSGLTPYENIPQTKSQDYNCSNKETV